MTFLHSERCKIIYILGDITEIKIKYLTGFVESNVYRRVLYGYQTGF